METSKENLSFLGKVDMGIKQIYLSYKQYKSKRRKARRSKRFMSTAMETLEMFDKCMNEYHYEYTLAFGTLLGAVREKGFISHDLDIDVAMWINDYDEKLIPALNKYGFKLVRSFSVDNDKSGKELTFKYKKSGIDIFFFYEAIDDMPYCCDFIRFPEGGNSFRECAEICGGLLPRRIEIPLSKNRVQTPFGNLKLYIPENAVEILEMRYGKDYMTPNPNWCYSGTNPYIKEWPSKLGVYKAYE